MSKKHKHKNHLIQFTSLKNFGHFAITGVLIGLFFSCSEPLYPDSKSPEEAMKTFHLDDRFEIQLFAAEPVVQDPVSMVFDERGNVYVVEMPDYPFKPESGPGNGKIKKLIDTDGDGVMDDFVVFADQITDGTSMLPWKNGLLVTAAPNILYIQDTNGDGIGDKKEILFSGFFQDNQETQIANLRFNVDNWIYASNGGHHGEIRASFDPDGEPLSVAGADFRFRMDTEEFERETAPGQFGQTFENYGRRFVSQNNLHIREMVIPWRYLHRHPFLPPGRALIDISDHDFQMYHLTEAPYWRIERSARRQKQYDEQGLDRIEHPDKHFTGSCGITFYGGDLFPKEFHHSTFSADVMGGIIHQDILINKQDQVTYSASRADNEKEREFLASTDMWFRPSNMTVGPDGALYVIDFYRQHAETPLAIPEDLKEDMDFLAGNDMGRIYRIVPKGTSKFSLKDIEGDHTTEVYLSWLTNPNQWYRLQAQRMLLQIDDDSILPQLEEIYMNNTIPAVRLQTLYLIDGLGGLKEEHIKKALQDPEQGVREHGLRLAEKFPTLIQEVAALKEEPSHRMLMQTALSLGNFNSELVVPSLGYILKDHYSDKWIRLAVLSSEPGSSMALIDYLDKNTGFFQSWDPDKENFLYEFTYIAAARNEESALLALISEFNRVPAENQGVLWKGIAAGFEKYEVKPSQKVKEKLNELILTASDSAKKALSDVL